MYTCDVSLPSRNEAHGTFMCIQTSVTFTTSRISAVFEDWMPVCICGPCMQAFARRSQDAEARCTLSLRRLVRRSSTNATLVLHRLHYAALCVLHVLWSLRTVFYEQVPCVVHSSTICNLDWGVCSRSHEFSNNSVHTALYYTLCHTCVCSVLQIPCSVRRGRTQGFLIGESPLKTLSDKMYPV